MQDKYEIKKAAAKDADEILSVEKQCFSSPWSRNIVLNTIGGKYTDILILKIGGAVCAFLAYSILGGEIINIDNIAVSLKERRKGYACALIDYLIKEGGADIESIELELRESNAAAAALYKKYGFSECGMRSNYYSNPKENALLMTLDLKKQTERGRKMIFGKRKNIKIPAECIGLEIRLESSVCTGETTIGFYDPETKKLRYAELVTSQKDIDRYCEKYKIADSNIPQL